VTFRPRQSAGYDGAMKPLGAALGMVGLVSLLGCNELSGLSALDKVDGSAQPPSVGPVEEPIGLTSGRHGTCVISGVDKLARCWGSYPGDGTESSLRPVIVKGIEPVTIVHGYNHRCARDENSDLWCWGNNDFGQLGDGTQTTRLLPTKVSGISGVVKVSGGAYHTCADTEAGGHYCWGANGYGQLGVGDTVDRNEPAAMTIAPTTHFGTGAFHGCAVLETPEILCWGRNDEGQLGLDPATTLMATTPQPVPGLPEVERVYGGVLTTCVRTTNTRELHCWGNNDFGQLGDGTTTASLTPVHVPEIERLGVLFPGVRHTCAYDTSAEDDTIKVFCWGANDHGQVGLPKDTPQYESPQLLAEGLANSGVSGKLSEHTCYLDADRQVVCAGLNDTGQLGDGTTDSRDSFAPVQF